MQCYSSKYDKYAVLEYTTTASINNQDQVPVHFLFYITGIFHIGWRGKAHTHSMYIVCGKKGIERSQRMNTVHPNSPSYLILIVDGGIMWNLPESLLSCC